MSNQTPTDPWQDVTWFVACQHCGATTTKSNLTFMGGLHCTRCDEVTEMPQEVAYRTNVDRARALTDEQHQREIADLIRAQDEEARRRIGGHPTCYSGEEIALADTVCFTSDVTLALGQRDETIRQLQAQIAVLQEQRISQGRRGDELQSRWESVSSRAVVAEAQVATLTQERGEAMKVLAPNMPESGLIDACRQVKQVAVSEAGNSTDWMNRAEAAEARCATLTAALRGLLSEATPQMCLNDHCGCTEQTALKKARAALAAAPQGGSTK